jgi:Esterase-like activity of phytase
MSGRAPPGAAMEPIFDLAGRALEPEARGADPEGVVALADGGFWVAEEYGPSLLRLDADGVVRARWTPKGRALAGAEERLPAQALRRRLNRGFEVLAISPDEAWLYVLLQSAAEGDDPLGTTIWKLDARDGALAGTFAYPFDAPESFVGDAGAGMDDLKACELVCVGPDRLLVLERITRSARIYRVDLAAGARLAKTLIFTTDTHPDITADLEGMALLSDRELLLVTDNDFGVEGAETRFYRVAFEGVL